MTRTAPRFAARLTPMLAMPAGIVVWEGLRISTEINPSLFPRASTVLLRSAHLLIEPIFYEHWIATVIRVISGFVIAAAFGITIGLGMGLSVVAFRILSPAVDFFRSIPITTLYPVFVLIAGIGDASKVSMIATGGLFIIALNTAYGVARGSSARRAVARLYGATQTQLIFQVIAMDALPQILVGLRVSISLSLVVAILTEMFMGANRGLGQRIMETYSTYVITDMYALIFLAGITGFLMNRAMARIERLTVPWADSKPV